MHKTIGGIFFRVLVSPAIFAAGLAWAQQPAAPARPAVATARVSTAPPRVLSLADLVRAALAHNPEIAAYASRAAALRARIRPAESLPDPTVSAGWMGKPLPFVLNRAAMTSYRGVSAMETFPFPGKLKLRGRMAERKSRAAWWDYQAVRRRVVAQLKAAYFQYAYCEQALAIVGNNRVLLEKLTKIAEARYQAGKGLQQDVLKGQLELSQLLEQIAILQEERRTAAARINTLLDRSPQAPLAPPAPLAQTPLAYTLARLYRLAGADDPGLQRDQRLIERDQDALALAHKSYDPDFSVSTMFQRMPGGPNMYGAFVGVSIPIFYKSKQRRQVAAAARSLDSMRSLRANRQTTVNYLVKQQFLAAEQASRLAVLYSQAIVPQSSQTLASSEMAYQAGKLDFLSLLDNFVNLLGYQVNYYRQISDYQIALARLEPLVGVELAK